jgi:hypothetical protein
MIRALLLWRARRADLDCVAHYREVTRDGLRGARAAPKRALRP